MPVSFDLAGKTALVTGASSGLGKAMALALAEAGADLFLVARRPELKAVAQEIQALGRDAVAHTADVGLPETAGQAVEACVAHYGRIDVLVNNAGVAAEGDSLTFALADWERTLRINLQAPFLFSQAAARYMIQQRRGKIIQVASMFGLSGEPNLAAYCASKGGLIQLTRSLAVEWARYNIQVNALAPGYFGSEMTAAGMQDEQTSRAMLRKIPARRFGEAAELGPLAVYLASPASDYMTGEVITIDGGRSAR